MKLLKRHLEVFVASNRIDSIIMGIAIIDAGTIDAGIIDAELLMLIF